ncbi:S8 family serine peptidase [Catellatospora tritici]|uniref:S8 family serine peptidase n=1 Tax=Catellatospora tritici TaxID=2851566 RepID=UPI001C2D9B4D|nr:S8 family serine peptidase [Catellatospora tritici]MBV1850319.1 S8 family serine peptidase [Catellatospora tritici]
MRSRRMLAGILAAAVVTSLLAGEPGMAGPQPAATARTGSGQQQAQAVGRTVTLVTGDRVTTHGDERISITPREGVQYLRYTRAGHRYVIPTDALPMLRADRLDLRLFDITGLLAAGYDRRDSLPLLVSGVGSTAAAPAGLTVTRRLSVLRGYAAKAPRAKLGSYWKNLKSAGGNARVANPGKVWLDGLRKPSLDVSVPQIGAPAAWAAGFDGTGVKVAVLDTGIDATHPDLAGKVAAEQNFATEYEDGLDHVGHGTHVASTIAGSGAASSGKYKGVAPGATLLDGKVCFEGGCAESWILDGMQWAAANGADVVNMSLGGTDGPEIDPIEQAVNDLTASSNILFVIAAGNAGGDETVGSPASADAALAVGAVYKNEDLAEFSSRGPRVGDAALKPEITGPGVDIVAANSKDGFLGEPGQPYTTLSGTSMATPHVAGAAALLTQVHPDWSAERRKTTLIGSAAPNPAIDGPFAQGAGRVDVARAINQSVTAEPAVVSLGRQEWPHGDDTVDVRTVTYRNGGAADVTLALALDTAAPAGYFSLSASTLTVPAGGTASVQLTSDVRGGTATGYFGGRITATAGAVKVTTPFAVDREEEKFTLSLPHLDLAGQPATDYLTILYNQETGKELVLFGGENPDTDLRVPAGTYLLFSWLPTETGVTQLVYPRLVVTGARTVTMDARDSGVFDVTVPDPTAIAVSADINVEFPSVNGGTIGVGASVGGYENLRSGPLDGEAVPGLLSWTGGTFAQVDADGNASASPVIYNGAWWQSDRIMTGFTKHLNVGDFAKVQAKHYAHVPGALGFKGAIAWIPGASSASALSIGTELPYSRAEYYTGDVTWEPIFDEVLIGEEQFSYVQSLYGGSKQYQTGRTYQETWNQAVFGPVLTRDERYADVLREGDLLLVGHGPYGDAAGHTGGGDYTSARTAVYRDGALLVETAEPFAFLEDVPAAPGRFRIESSVERGAPAILSTKEKTVWTFRSGHTDELTRLPVTALGFAPALSDRNTAKAGSLAVIPVTPWQQFQSGAGSLRKLTVQVSFDDGKHWVKAPVLHLGGCWLVTVLHPNKAGFVSIKAAGEDSKGNTVEQTIIRAYRLVK